MNYLICNKAQIPIFKKVVSDLQLQPKDVVFISEENQLKEICSGSIDLYGFLLVDVDMNFGIKSRTEFYGFEIAADLRRLYGLRNQIIFYSHYFSDTYFEQKSKSGIKYKLLFGRGSSFLEFPYTLESLKETLLDTKPISPATLHDVVTMLCDLKGVVIDKLTHGLKFEHGSGYTAQLFTDIEPYLSSLQKQNIEFFYYLEKLQNSFAINSKTDYDTHKEVFLKLCSLHLTQSSTIEPEHDKITHTLLLIDDRKEDLEKFASELSKYFKIIQTISSEKAIEILEKDSSNNIKAVIADWRLFRDDSLTYWQPLQGYEVLEYAARTGIRALFALTSQADYVIHPIRNLLGIRFSLFKKDYLETETHWKIFRDVLTDACEETTNLITNIPKGTGWTTIPKGKKSLQQQYSEHRNSPDWVNFETSISEQSNLIWDYYQSYLNKTEVETLQDFSKRFGRVLRNNIENILIARRICIGLWYNQGKIHQNILGKNYPRIDVYSVFRNTFFEDVLAENLRENSKISDPKEQKAEHIIEEDTLSKMNNAASGLLNSTLCLDVEDLASFGSMLPEEKNWIAEKGIKIDLELNELTGDNETTSDYESFSKFDKEPTANDMIYFGDDFQTSEKEEDDDY